MDKDQMALYSKLKTSFLDANALKDKLAKMEVDGSTPNSRDLVTSSLALQERIFLDTYDCMDEVLKALWSRWVSLYWLAGD